MHGEGGMVSVIIVYNDCFKIQECKRYITMQSIHDFVEIIAIDNRKGIFSSAAKALNYGSSMAKNPVLVFMHQDLYLWDDKALEKYYEYLIQHPTDIAGAAGLCTIDNKMHSDIFETLNKIQRMRKAYGEVMTAWSLDECMFAMQKSLWEKLKFDESVCYNWHMYAVEICCHNLTNGNRNVVLPVQVCHESLGGGRNHTYEQSLKNLINKYYGKFQYIYAPGTICRCTLVGYYTYEFKRLLRQQFLKLKGKIKGL